MSNEIEIVISKKNNAQLDQLGKDAKKAGQDVADGLKKGFKEGEDASGRARRQISQDLDKTAQDAKKAGERAGTEFGGGLGDSARDALAGGGVGGVVDGLTDGIKGAGGAIGAAGIGLATALMAGFTQSLEANQIAGELAVQVGATREEAGKLGHIAGDVFAANFGESLPEVAAAMKAVFQNRLIDRDAAEADIKHLTELAMTASQVVGEEANNIARAAEQLLVNGLARDAEHAMDIIVTASQQGLNVNEDLIDTIVEYSTKFRDLGISGEEAMGLIAQSMQAGARDTDYAADALKEFAIRAQDGSESTARGFASIGVEAESMGNMIAAGGNSAHAALRNTLDGLRAIEDPVQRNQAAVDLFGTKAEDLGHALYAMDLDTVADSFSEVAGAAQKASDDIGAAASPIETAWRNLGTALKDTFEFAFAAPEIPENVKKAMEEARALQRKDAEEKEAYKRRVDDAAHAAEREAGSIKKVTVTLEQNIETRKKAAGGVINLAEAEMGYQAALDDVAEKLKDNGKTLDINTEKGRENKTALLDVADAAFEQIEAMEKQGSTAADVTRSMETARGEFIRLAVQLGMSGTEANKLADKLRLIPGDYRAHIGLNGADIADNMIRTLKGRLIDLTNRPYVASVSVTQTRSSGGGRMFVGLADGGPVGAGMSHAAEGGPRGQMVVTQEQGPEIGIWPDGSMIIPAGMSRAIMGSLGGGGGRSGGDWAEVRMTFDGNLDSLMASAWMKAQDLGLIRVMVR